MVFFSGETMRELAHATGAPEYPLHGPKWPDGRVMFVMGTQELQAFAWAVSKLMLKPGMLEAQALALLAEGMK